MQGTGHHERHGTALEVDAGDMSNVPTPCTRDLFGNDFQNATHLAALLCGRLLVLQNLWGASVRQEHSPQVVAAHGLVLVLAEAQACSASRVH